MVREPKPLTAQALPGRGGRPIKYLRVSLTERCRLRCLYCTGGYSEGAADGADLSAEDIERVVTVAHRLGVSHVRLTGGEPLERPEVVEIVARLGRLGLRDLSLTTNGVRLAGFAPALRRAGLVRVNVSLPDLRPEGYRRVTGEDLLEEVLAGIEAARSAGLTPVKTNTVLMRGVNDDAVVALAEFARRTGVVVRFIEYMAPQAGQEPAQRLVPAAEVVALLRDRFGLVPVSGSGVGAEGVGPARYYRLGGGGLVGVIAPVTEPFCEGCNRLRLTSRGRLRPCLYDEAEVDLLPALRSRSWQEALEEAFRRAASLKPRFHAQRLPGTMRLIGG